MDSARELELDASDKIHLVEHRISPFINQMLAQDAPSQLCQLQHAEAGAGEDMRGSGESSGLAVADVEAAILDAEGGWHGETSPPLNQAGWEEDVSSSVERELFLLGE